MGPEQSGKPVHVIVFDCWDKASFAQRVLLVVASYLRNYISVYSPKIPQQQKRVIHFESWIVYVFISVFINEEQSVWSQV